MFAEKGHREATLVEICERANANIAAAKYYFRDKATLYAGAWRMCVIEAPRSKPPGMRLLLRFRHKAEKQTDLIDLQILVSGLK